MNEKMLRLKEAVHNDSDFLNGDVHQAIMNVGYDWWQNTKGASMEDMILHVREKYGPVAEFAILFGKFNQQVENGGILQWIDNGYADVSSKGNYGSYDPDLPTRWRMLDLMDELDGVMALSGANEVKTILESIKWFGFDDFESEEEFYECNSVNDECTNDYYEVNKEWMDALNDYFLNCLNEG